MIEANGIGKTYRVRSPEDGGLRGRKKWVEIDALKDVDIRIGQGEVFGILGPNGAGKTTLIKILAGLLLPSGGTASVNGFDVLKDREKVRTSVNLLRSGDWVIFDYKLSLLDNLKYWGMVSGLKRTEAEGRVKEVLTMVGLEEKLKEYPENLSAGMRQKLSLARCLLSDRPVYLLDEPTANIDPVSANFIRQFARDALAMAGKTILLATHNLWEAEMMCNRILILNKGQELIQDSTRNIKRTKGEEYASVTLDRAPNKIIKAIESLPFVESVTLEGDVWMGENLYYRITVYGQVKMNIQKLLSRCLCFAKVLNIELKEPTLNDVFLKLLDKEKGGAT